MWQSETKGITVNYFYSKTDWMLILVLCAVTVGEAVTFLFFAFLRTTCNVPVPPAFLIGEVCILIFALIVGVMAFLAASKAK